MGDEKRIPGVLVIFLRACRLPLGRIVNALRVSGYGKVSKATLSSYLRDHQEEVALLASVLERGPAEFFSSLRILQLGIERNIGTLFDSLSVLEQERDTLVAKQDSLTDGRKDPSGADPSVSRALVSVVNRLTTLNATISQMANAVDWNARLRGALQFLREGMVRIFEEHDVVLPDEVASSVDDYFVKTYKEFSIREMLEEDRKKGKIE